MIDALARALARHLLELVQERRQLQLLEMMSQQNLGGAGHGAGRKGFSQSPNQGEGLPELVSGAFFFCRVAPG
jgi:hypothetical protein